MARQPYAHLLRIILIIKYQLITINEIVDNTKISTLINIPDNHIILQFISYIYKHYLFMLTQDDNAKALLGDGPGQGKSSTKPLNPPEQSLIS